LEAISIAGILYFEIGEIADYIKQTLGAIYKATDEKQPIFRGESGVYERSHTLAYWLHEDALYSSSGTFWMPFQWTAGNAYESYINQHSDRSEQEEYFYIQGKMRICYL